MQIRAFRPSDEKTQKKYLEVVRTCANHKASEAAKHHSGAGGAAAMDGNASGHHGHSGHQAESNSTISGIFGPGGLQTGYFVLSTFTLKKMVF